LLRMGFLAFPGCLANLGRLLVLTWDQSGPGLERDAQPIEGASQILGQRTAALQMPVPEAILLFADEGHLGNRQPPQGTSLARGFPVRLVEGSQRSNLQPTTATLVGPSRRPLLHRHLPGENHAIESEVMRRIA